MSAQPEGHGRPESEPPGGLVEILRRWELSGGHWKVLRSSDMWVDIGLFSCDGTQQMSRVSGVRTSVLRGYLDGRASSAD